MVNGSAELQPTRARDHSTAPHVSVEWLHRHHLCPTAHDDGDNAVVLGTDVTDPRDVAELAVAWRTTMSLRRVSGEELERAIERYRRETTETIQTEQLPEERADEDTRGLASQPPVVRYVNLLVREAVAARASDIHLDATRNALTCRIRVDGMLLVGPEVLNLTRFRGHGV
jgi:type II secretory ATPase GspE/PulE/Tfp pilus assembly ATPase PilB-like protein